MNILHIAAFEGNIGDNASHLGFLNILDGLMPSYEIHRLEIRKAYKNYTGKDKLRFDDEFVKLANSYDLVVFGGGGFLDYWVEGSNNGTTIDISQEVFEKINTEVVITSVGSNPHREVPKENYKKFELFLKYVRSKSNITIALRNDGSINSIRNDFGESALEGLVEILDHGYFYKPTGNYVLPIDEPYVAINVTDDQLNMRGGINEDRDWYYNELKIVIENVTKRGYKIVFVPHIHQDVEAIGSVLNKLPSGLARASTIVAPCIQSDSGTDLIFNTYKNAKLVIASRYHANVCSIKLGVPTIGLSPLDRIKYTHNQMTLNQTAFSHSVSVGFSDAIVSNINDIENGNYEFNLKQLDELKNKTISFYKKLFNIK